MFERFRVALKLRRANHHNCIFIIEKRFRLSFARRKIKICLQTEEKNLCEFQMTAGAIENSRLKSSLVFLLLP